MLFVTRISFIWPKSKKTFVAKSDPVLLFNNTGQANGSNGSAFELVDVRCSCSFNTNQRYVINLKPFLFLAESLRQTALMMITIDQLHPAASIQNQSFTNHLLKAIPLKIHRTLDVKIYLHSHPMESRLLVPLILLLPHQLSIILKREFMESHQCPN